MPPLNVKFIQNKALIFQTTCVFVPRRKVRQLKLFFQLARQVWTAEKTSEQGEVGQRSKLS